MAKVKNASNGEGPPKDETLKAVAQLKNEHGLRGSKRESSVPEQTASPPPSATSLPRKRPAPKTSGAAKKGTAKKPPSKRRKVEDDTRSIDGASVRSATPSRPSKPTAAAKSAARTSQSGTPAGSSPPRPSHSPPAADADEADEGSASDTELYCICRKPDNHSWMIACDGGCEDWFHGKCVNMRESDGDLIDKYICPNCEQKGSGNTTWKPMCRREGCRRPARLKPSNLSKYCSDECGQRFMRERLGVTSSQEVAKPKNRRKANYTDNFENAIDGVGHEHTDDDDLGPRGGTLRPKEVKALLMSVKDV
ncbi:hypothetical protein LTS18_000344, partial [Coniosporium uncinatum]